jgi:hypothetical protein
MSAVYVVACSGLRPVYLKKTYPVSPLLVNVGYVNLRNTEISNKRGSLMGLWAIPRASSIKKIYVAADMSRALETFGATSSL